MSLRFVPCAASLSEHEHDDRNRIESIRLPSPPLDCCAQGILFDLGNILCDDTAWRRWLLRLLQQLGLQTYYRGFFRVWDCDFLDAVHRGERTFRDALEAFLLSAGLSHGQIEEVLAACQARRRDLSDSARPLPGVRTTLAQLVENGWTLGILCNSECSSIQLRTQLTRLGIDGWFRAVVSSLDLQHAMPDLECYHAALAEMRMTASEVVFVGHDAAELRGAATAGMATLAFNFEPDVEADGYLSRFEDLLNMVKLPSLPWAAAS